MHTSLFNRCHVSRNTECLAMACFTSPIVVLCNACINRWHWFRRSGAIGLCNKMYPMLYVFVGFLTLWSIMLYWLLPPCVDNHMKHLYSQREQSQVWTECTIESFIDRRRMDLNSGGITRLMNRNSYWFSCTHIYDIPILKIMIDA